MKELTKLYFAFFRIGLFTFGGGYSMLPMLEREVVERHNWATREQLLDYFAIGQCTPGIIAVNTATLVGYTERGFMGSVFATAGIVSPSLIIITAIAAVLKNFTQIPEVIHAFAGIRAAVAALIAAACVKLFKSNVLNTKAGEGMLTLSNALPVLICVSAFAVVAVFGVSPVYVIVSATVAGLLLCRK